MSDGLRRASLATLETREWTVEGRPLTGAQVVALYHAIPHRNAMFQAVGAGGSASDRRFDRAIQILKKNGLVEYKGSRWQRVGDS